MNPSRRTVAGLLATAPLTFNAAQAVEVVDVKAFGAKGDGVTDDTAAIQAAIDAAAYLGRPGRVILPEGQYLISDTIHLGYGVAYKGSPYRSIILEGDGSGLRGEKSLRGSILIASFSDRPAIAIQGGRRIRVKNLGLRGLNFAHIQGKRLGDSHPEFDDTSAGVWVAPDLAATATDRYAPYAAIAIDPYSGQPPDSAYPTVHYPAFLGPVEPYQKAFSSQTVIDDVHISGFVVGVAIQPCNDDGNGDFVTLRDTTIEYCTYGYSVGNSQGRQNNMINVMFASCHTAITNNKHGRRIGKLGGTISGCTFDRCIQALNVEAAYAAPMAFQGCYGELLWRIGSLGGRAPRAAPISFQGCEFKMAYHPAVRGVPASYGDGGGAMLFQGGNLRSSEHMHFLCELVIQGTKIDCVEVSDRRANLTRLIAHDWSLDITGPFRSLALAPPQTVFINLYKTLNEQAGEPRLLSDIQPGTGRNNPFTRLTERIRWVRDGATSAETPVPRAYVRLKRKSDTRVEFQGIAGVIEFGDVPYGIASGDLVEDDQTRTIFLVEAAAGSGVSVRALNNRKAVGPREDFRAPVNGRTGYWYISLSRLYATSFPLFADVTSGSNVIANCGRTDGYAGFIGQDCAVGDLLFEFDGLPRYFPLGTRITEVDVRARTMTMSTKALRTTGTVLLPVWVRA